MPKVTLRKDGIVELTPRRLPLDGSDRLLLVSTVLLGTGGLFVSGAIPAPVLAAVVAASLAVEAFFGLRALALLLLRPAAEVLEVAAWRDRRR